MRRLEATRPTAVNLRWALDGARLALEKIGPEARARAAYERAGEVCEHDVAVNRAIGEHGLDVLRSLRDGRGGGRALRILTHCNAGWLATVDRGTATAPVYQAHEEGWDLHVWVDETRPRLQGAALTAWELGQEGIAHTLLADSAAAHLLSQGEVDGVLVGTDRTTADGDVVNKVGTYPLALAAADNDVPFYVAVPSSSIDWSIADGRDVPIEQRDVDEVTTVRGQRIAPPGTPAVNFAFDVTPRHLVTGLITERGICAAEGDALRRLFAEGADTPTPT